MAAADRRAHELDRAVVDLAEALVLAPCVGRTFDAVVVDDDDRAGVVQLRDPAVRARCRHRGGAALPLGGPLTVRLVEADPLRRGVVFEPA
jgi:exoribonuclease R